MVFAVLFSGLKEDITNSKNLIPKDSDQRRKKRATGNPLDGMLVDLAFRASVCSILRVCMGGPNNHYSIKPFLQKLANLRIFWRNR